MAKLTEYVVSGVGDRLLRPSDLPGPDGNLFSLPSRGSAKLAPRSSVLLSPDRKSGYCRLCPISIGPIPCSNNSKTIIAHLARVHLQFAHSPQPAAGSAAAMEGTVDLRAPEILSAIANWCVSSQLKPSIFGDPAFVDLLKSISSEASAQGFADLAHAQVNVPSPYKIKKALAAEAEALRGTLHDMVASAEYVHLISEQFRFDNAQLSSYDRASAIFALAIYFDPRSDKSSELAGHCEDYLLQNAADCYPAPPDPIPSCSEDEQDTSMDAIYRAKRPRPTAVLDPRSRLAREITAYKEHDMSTRRWRRREIFNSEDFWVHSKSAIQPPGPLGARRLLGSVLLGGH